MIELTKLEALVRLMVDNDLSEVDLHDSEMTVTIKRSAPHAMHAPPPPVHHHAPSAPSPSPSAKTPAPAGAGEDDGLVAIESPMVGSFYSSPNPDSPAFVSVGSSVGPDTIVCLIEAMKVFNEVKAERAGKIERILVQNGAPVEFGQKLFLIRPA